jgi:hypothetical protein
MNIGLLFAQSSAAAATPPDASVTVLPSIAAQLVTTPPRYEFARLAGYENWQYALLGLICVVVLGFVFWMYRRDSVELKPGVGILMAFLRIGAFVGLLLHYLDLQKRSDVIKTDNSVAVLIVDGTASMQRNDTNDVGLVPTGPSRIQTVIDAFKSKDLVQKLQKTHDVVIYRFDSDATRVGGVKKLGSESPAPEETASPKPLAVPAEGTSTPAPVGPALPADPKRWNWEQLLAAGGAESRYGQTLRQVIFEERSKPLSGVLMIGDFAHNSGLAPEEGIKVANEASLPIHTAAVGSTKTPVNAAIADFRAPPRVYPDDKFQINALIQGSGINGRNVEVKLYVKETDPGMKDDGKPGELVVSETVLLRKNEDAVFAYESPGVKEAGRQTYTLVLEGLPDDSNPADNKSQVDVEIVERKNRVLLFAGGATREYQFLRNQLRRDKYTVVDVILQNAREGISQDANKILDDFPRTFQELAGTKNAMGEDEGGYDVIVAFDPDWRKLDEEQVDALERWLARDSGGLVVVAGPVFMDAWLENDGDVIKKVRSFYPVEFDRRLLAIDNSKFVNEIPWPVEYTPEGQAADFFWLGSTAEESNRAWADFPGVYGFYQVSKAKPGAIVYSYFSNPDAAISGKPIYFAEQFYGSGRVFYMGSGEMWRLNEDGLGYFEQFYTKLLRHVSQGRLLRGSRLGTLLLDRDRYIQGTTIPVRAQLQNLRQEPLEVDKVELGITLPDGSLAKSIDLKPDPARKGFYQGQFNAVQVGTYQLQLTHPESSDVITKRIQVATPQLEVDNPQRDDTLAKRIAETTKGKFYVGMDAVAADFNDEITLAKMFPDQKKTKLEATNNDRDFQEEWSKWLMLGIVGFLCAEWILRRICRLA